MKNKKRSLSYNSDKKRRILIGCSIAGTAVLMTGTGIGIGYAIWYNNNDKTGWDFDSKSYDKYDNEVSQAPDGTYDAFSAREEYLRNFEINFKVDFRHYVNDSIRSFATFSNVETSYDVFITKHNFDVDRGLIKDFQATVFLTLYTDEQEQGTERFTLNVHNYYLLGAFTPANIYFDEATPTHAHTNAWGNQQPIQGNYLSFTPAEEEFGFIGDDCSGFSYSAPIPQYFSISSYFNSRAISMLEGDGAHEHDFGLYLNSFVLDKITNITPINLSSLLPTATIHIENKLACSAKDFCTYYDKAAPENNRSGDWFHRVVEGDEADWETPVDTAKAQLFNKYIASLPTSMQVLKVKNHDYPINQVLTSIDLRAYGTSTPNGEETNLAVWTGGTTNLYSNLFLHLAVNPCFSLGSTPNGYYTAQSQHSMLAELYQSDGNYDN